MISDPDDEHVDVNNEEEEEEPFSLAQPYGSRASTCGYCGPPGARSVTRSSYTFGLDAVQLSCMVRARLLLGTRVVCIEHHRVYRTRCINT